MDVVLLKQKAVEEITGLSASTLEQWRLQGKGPKFVKLGRSVRYPAADLNEFIAGLDRYTSTTEAGNARLTTKKQQ
ncbi:helix-turn-helix transcriptional regulator [Geomesophilobacter sediminis]|uniref:Helix-turn-helix domain-containing protein n=1 Tax=Geomesophilobacter sediminis TaxID=2798584 RepID=A0A8J7JDT6_9BACT|nr:helix-turn-helix domain-containing protein [Geomesophilobacter sediminis]MBJ6725408.1 helix-turn-helix domain-containing protein [Geomesophilobacter sediminis]